MPLPDLGKLVNDVVGGSQTVADVKEQATQAASAAAIWGVVVAIELFVIILLLAKVMKRRGS